jgi:stage IV sporulation protein FB
MGWESRQYGRSGGGDRFRDVMGRIFGDSRNIWGWSLPLYRAWGIQVRLHLLFVLVIAWQLIASAIHGGGELQWTATWIGTLFGLVLLHEYGHCIACRWVGGSADQILLWPLGGLASCHPPRRWTADLVTTLGGPGVNAVLWPILGGTLWSLIPEGARSHAIMFNPLSPKDASFFVHLRDGTRPFWLLALWSAYLTNSALLLFNMLLVMYPMDAGRTARDLLWPRLGYRRATMIMAMVGLCIAVPLFFYGLLGGAWVLTGVALFGASVCWTEWQVQKYMPEEDPILGGYNFDRGYGGMPGAAEEERESERRARAREKRVQQEREDQAELDRILAKIAQSGMASLSTSEKRWLERATERRRRA